MVGAGCVLLGNIFIALCSIYKFVASYITDRFIHSFTSFEIGYVLIENLCFCLSSIYKSVARYTLWTNP